jgi:transcriptional regulator with XRE-family HTH domain
MGISYTPMSIRCQYYVCLISIFSLSSYMAITYIDTAMTICKTSDRVVKIGEAIRLIRTARQWSLDAMSERSGVNRMSLSEIERGIVDPRRSTLEKITRGLGYRSMEDLISDASRMAPGGDLGRHDPDALYPGAEFEPANIDISRGYVRNDVPVVGGAEASTNGLITWSDDGVIRAEVEDFVSRSFADGDPRAYALRVRGDSMVPRYRPGEIVVAQPRLQARDGDYACVQLASGERLIKRVFRDDGGWILHSENPSYPDRKATNEEIVAMHRIKHSIAP